MLIKLWGLMWYNIVHITSINCLNNIKVQALKELGYTEINENNATEVFEKIAEIQSRKVGVNNI